MKPSLMGDKFDRSSEPVRKAKATGSTRPISGLAAAKARGALAREKLKDVDGGSVSTQEARRYLGNISKSSVLKRYKNRRLLGWREVRQNAVRYPIWQFSNGDVIPGLVEVLDILGKIGDWRAILFFLNTRSSLGGRRPLDAMRDGDLTSVIRAAHGYVER